MKIVTFIDSIGRTLLGEEAEQTGSLLKVKNPAMINVAQTQNGQLQVQLIPLFFSEFVSEEKKKEGTVWSYNLNTVVLGDVDLDARLVEQYTRIFNAVPASAPAEQEPVIKLFDE